MSVLLSVYRPLQWSIEFLNIHDWEIKKTKVCLQPAAIKYLSMYIWIFIENFSGCKQWQK